MRGLILMSLVSVAGCKSAGVSGVRDIRVLGNGQFEDWVDFTKDHVLREKNEGGKAMVAVYECAGRDDQECSRQSPQFAPVPKETFAAFLRNALSVESYKDLEERQADLQKEVDSINRSIGLATALLSWGEFGSAEHQAANESILKGKEALTRLNRSIVSVAEELKDLKAREQMFNDAIKCVEKPGRCDASDWSEGVSASYKQKQGKIMGLYLDGARVANRNAYFVERFEKAPKNNATYRQAVQYCQSLGPDYKLPNAEETLLAIQYFGEQMPRDAKLWTRAVSNGLDENTTYRSGYDGSIYQVRGSVSSERFAQINAQNEEVRSKAAEFKNRYGRDGDPLVDITYYDGGGNARSFSPDIGESMVAAAYCVRSRFSDSYGEVSDHLLKLSVGQLFIQRTSSSSVESYSYERVVKFHSDEQRLRSALSKQDYCNGRYMSCSDSFQLLIK